MHLLIHSFHNNPLKKLIIVHYNVIVFTIVKTEVQLNVFIQILVRFSLTQILSMHCASQLIQIYTFV